MTSTNVISGQSFGTSTNKGNGLFSPSATTLAGTTTAFVVSAIVTAGTDAVLKPGLRVRVWYTTTTHTVAAADAPSKLGQTARYVDVDIDRPVAIRDSSLEPVTGSKFHCWVDAPTLDVAATLTVALVELP